MRNQVLLFLSCTAVLASSCIVQHFDKQAHRGGAGLMPENSIAGAINCVKHGWTIEMDLYMSKDSQLVVTHDPHIVGLYALYPNRELIPIEEGKKLVLKEMNYRDIQEYEIGLGKHPTYPRQLKVHAYIPLCTALIDSAEAYAKAHDLKKPSYNIQAGPAYTITDVFRKDFVKKMMDIILAKKINKRSMFQSFDVGMLETMHRDYPKKIEISYLVGDRPNLDTMLNRLSFVPEVYSPYFPAVSKKLVDDCHAKKMKIVPWTINEIADIQRVKALGVDGVITDYPDLL